MSDEPLGPDANGDVDLEENPEPEEDADWTQAERHAVENADETSCNNNYPANEQGEDPEALSSVNCSGALREAAIATDSNTHNLDNENELLSPDSEPVAALNHEVSLSNPEEDENEREEESVTVSLVEGDSFEQDERIAAPESENGVIQQSCIESDQQLQLGAGSAVSAALVTESLSNSTTECNSNIVPNSEENDGSNNAPSIFSGDVEVDNSNGIDAPEDDFRLDRDEVSSALEGGAALLLESGRSVPTESPVIESQRTGGDSSLLDAERDSQIPECDRKEEGEVSFQSAGSNIHVGLQGDQGLAESVQESVEDDVPRNSGVEYVEHFEIGNNNLCESTDISANIPPPPQQSHARIDQSDNQDCLTGAELQISSGTQQADPSPSSSPSHSNSKFEHSNISSATHQHHQSLSNTVDNSEINNPRVTTNTSSTNSNTVHQASPAPNNMSVSPSSASSSLLNALDSENPSGSRTVFTMASTVTQTSATSTECSLNSTTAPVTSSTDAINNHNPVVASNLKTSIDPQIEAHSSEQSESSFHASDVVSYGETGTAIQTKHKETAPSPLSSLSSLSSSSTSSSGQSKENLAMESPEDYYQKQLALALSKDDEDDELDDFMSELDAELLSRSSKSSPQRSKPCSNSSPSKTTTTTDVSQSKNNEKSKMVNGVAGESELKKQQDHNRQLLEQLMIRDTEIRKLSEERDSSQAELTKVKAQYQDTLAKASSSHSADDLYLPQITELEKTIVQLQKENQATKEKLISHDTAAKRAVTTLQNELKIRVDQVTKLYEEAVKEKDSMVVMFASSESRVMESKKAMEKAENRLKDAIKEKESLIATLKGAKMDKHKVVNSLEQKCSEVGDVKREMEKLKEALSSADYRIKWFQNKLKEELETHKETKTSLDKTTSKLKETKEETEIIRRECQAIVKTYQESEEIKSNSLDKELKMKESQLKLQMREWSDNEEIHQRTKKELESLKIQHKEAVVQMTAFKEQVHSLEMSVAEKDSTIAQSNKLLNKQKADITDTTSKLKEKQTLDEDFSRAQEMIKSLDKDVSELKVSNRDLQKDMESCRERESKMLALQSELSRTNACLRSENTTLSNKATNLTAEVERLKMEIQEMETTVKHLTDSVEDEKKNNSQGLAKLKVSLEEKTKECADFKQKWEDEIDSNKTLKRRHANNVKDLTRQLQQTRRRLEVVEGSRKDSSGSMGSRTNSNGSLNSMVDSNHQPGGGGVGGAGHHSNTQTGGSTGTSSANSQEFPVITEQVEIDKQVLIERIVRLQKSHARKNEKLEFLGEHIQQLLEEIKKKTKIIQSYVMREEAGTLSSEDMDANKDKVNEAHKAEARQEMQSLLSRKGGIMASMYTLHQQDGTMTLELSLQINKKLQAVLEDTLLKNITLKENLDTLGEEIARLSQVNRKLQLHLHDLENPKKH